MVSALAPAPSRAFVGEKSSANGIEAAAREAACPRAPSLQADQMIQILMKRICSRYPRKAQDLLIISV